MKHSHPGRYLREHVIPKNVSVTRAADILGVSRPALSNLLNAKAALSPEMSIRLELAFGVSAEELVQMQTEFDVEQHSQDRHGLQKAVKFVPPFLLVRANDIEDWANTLAARHQLAVLLRKLIHSTSRGETLVDFPGNDDSQRPGWDGLIQAEIGNPWIPKGRSCWEFGTGKDVADKANKDYRARTKTTAEEERMETTFVFVTPRRWSAKESWLVKKRTEGKWRDVTALDASDLEQWLEQSIAAQAWFDTKWSQKIDGVKSLERCWDEWCADCDPKFTMDVFAEPASIFGQDLRKHLLSDRAEVLRIIADSQLEGLAFLATYLLRGDKDSRQLADKVVVFTKAGYLPTLTVSSPEFIPVIAHPDAELEFAQLGFKLKAVVVDHQEAKTSQSSITLRPLSDKGFRNALESMSRGPDEIGHLIRESGRSLTVLRRRLAQSEQLKRPDWAKHQDVANSLAPMALTGTWLNNNDADLNLLKRLTRCDASTLDNHFLQLRNMKESPVWTIGEYQGVVSKLDVLYSVSRWLSADLFKKFLNIAKLVLSEKDPSLDLPEEERWAAPVYGKVPVFSDPLRKGISESLVLLAIHGEHLFGDLVPEPEQEIANLICSLLEPMSVTRLLSQCEQLPLYAEAAPDAFLGIFERDLERDEPVVATLMKPATDTLFSRNERVHLLWALELLAWNPEWLVRVITLLAQLEEREPADNLSNKPSNTLLSIFRSWMPQTGASLDEREAALKYLIRRSPKVAWRILTKQFELGKQIGGYSPKPLWRDYAIGLGEPVGNSERCEFVQHCINTCIDWPTHSATTLADLTEKTEQLHSKQLNQLKEAIEKWNATTTDDDRSFLRERIRGDLGIIKLRAGSERIPRKKADERIHTLQSLFETLQPHDLVWRHAWLFEKNWVEPSYEEIEDEQDYEARRKQIKNKQNRALREIREALGVDGVMQLAFCGDAPQATGRTFVHAVDDLDAQISLLKRVLSDANLLESHPHQLFVSGIFSGMGPECAVSVVEKLKTDWEADVIAELLRLTPFDNHVWTALPTFGEAIAHDYWLEVNPSWAQHGAADLNYAISQLLAVGRSYAAFDFAHLDWQRVDSIHIQSILLDLTSTAEIRQLSSRNAAYAVERALSLLNERGALSQSELARLELLYLDFCRHGEYGIPNLEREIESKPELFCDVVALTRRKTSEEEEPTKSDYRAAQIAFRLLGELKHIPGHDDDGQLNAELLMDWVRKVQMRSETLDCRNSADHRIGEILSHAPLDDDGIWPCRPVREVLDAVLNSDMESGFQIGRRNSRGVQIRERGGDQERELAEQYEEWARGCDYEYPRVAATLRQLATSFRREGLIWDKDTAVRDRLGH